MRKAVAVPYVIALILGVAVIALLGIWFVSSGGKFSKQSAETECRNTVLLHCTKLISGLPSSLTFEQSKKCDEVGIIPPGDLTTCRTQGYVS